MKRNPHDRIIRGKFKEQHLKMSNFILHILNHHLKKKKHGFKKLNQTHLKSWLIEEKNLWVFVRKRKIWKRREIKKEQECVFGMSWIFQLISTFNLFLLLFICLTALFDTIHESHSTIQLIFYFFLFLHFQQKVFNFS